MSDKRGCGWMAGPRDTSVQLSAAKWWFAISRDMFTKTQRNQVGRVRPTVSCHMTPTFRRPLIHNTKG